MIGIHIGNGIVFQILLKKLKNRFPRLERKHPA